MKRLIFTFLVSASCPCWAQTTLSDQINAVSNAQDYNNAQQAAAQAQQRSEQMAEERREAAIASQQRAEEKAARDQQAQAAQAAAAAAQAENQKRLDFDDQQRQLVIEEEKIKLQEEQTAANRQNDAINHDLKQQDAQTDLIQSQADSNRNLSTGTETLLKDDGTAAVNNSVGLFGH